MIKISFNISLPANLSIDDVEQKIRAVREKALDMPINRVTDIEKFKEEPAVGFYCSFDDGFSTGIFIQLDKTDKGWSNEDEFWTIAGIPDSEFLRRHRAVINLLKICEQQGFTVQVWDEGGYWCHLNPKALLGFKHVMEKISDPRESVIN